jgi:hypothetical protein
MMKRINQFVICLVIGLGGINACSAQKADTAKQAKENSIHPYFIINAGTEITAFFNDKPVSVSSIEDFNNYVQVNAKNLKDAWAVVTGKPKTGTFDEVIKTLKRNRFKHISQNIIKD